MNHRATELLGELSIRGVAVRTEGSHLCLRPKSAITPELRDRVLGLKRDLMELLTSRSFPRLTSAGACPTPAEWSVLEALVRAGQLNYRQLVAATRLAPSTLDRALLNLYFRGELRYMAEGRYVLVCH